MGKAHRWFASWLSRRLTISHWGSGEHLRFDPWSNGQSMEIYGKSGQSSMNACCKLHRLKSLGIMDQDKHLGSQSWDIPMQHHATSCNFMQLHATSCNFMQLHATSCNYVLLVSIMLDHSGASLRCNSIIISYCFNVLRCSFTTLQFSGFTDAPFESFWWLRLRQSQKRGYEHRIFCPSVRAIQLSQTWMGILPKNILFVDVCASKKLMSSNSNHINHPHEL